MRGNCACCFQDGGYGGAVTNMLHVVWAKVFGQAFDNGSTLKAIQKNTVSRDIFSTFEVDIKWVIRLEKSRRSFPQVLMAIYTCEYTERLSGAKYLVLNILLPCFFIAE